MGKVEYTPGPWKWWTSNSLKRLTSHAGGRHGPDGGVLHAYRCTDGMADIQVSHADMALIAAAPDLLEALERCLRYIEGDELAHGRQFGEGNAARAALSKAKGETQ